MTIPRRLRFSLLAAMVIVALAAVFFGWMAAERRKRVAALAIRLQRQEERVRWAEQMQRLGYVPASRLAAEQREREKVRAEIEGLGGIPKSP